MKIKYIFLITVLLFTFSCKKEEQTNSTQTQTTTPVTAATPAIVFNSKLVYSEVSDVEGNKYKTIKIGNQTWMAENLRTKKLKNGKAIFHVADFNEWLKDTSLAYCYYDNNPDKYKIYGLLYKGYSIDTNLCPSGWHLPSAKEWQTLIDTVGGDFEKLKEVGKTHWPAENSGGTNASGFTAVPGGFREPFFGTYQGVGKYTEWWSSTFTDETYSAVFQLSDKKNSYIETSQSRAFGLYVRCVKN